MKINIGCGWRNFGGDWVHVDGGDYSHLDSKDVNLPEYAPNTADLIYASHLIAYFDRDEIKLVLDNENDVEEYANFAVVTHSPAEFVVDFFRILPGVSNAKVKSRIIISPVHLKTFLKALQDNVGKYEDKFGEIISYLFSFFCTSATFFGLLKNPQIY